ncbi:methyltransferase domain-containing protein [Methanoregula sp.]|uniref:class I SAM-dependent methyltransferase n=1 Tax=Methanoregula sp. TaxID=2052170 RepID=UPI0026391119|nr:methyltransferase domain-containing protein [Methanoregula sp.]MDD5143951.1 methyltransferase domain-containing protein [Methanoregula sp.]
MNRVQQEKIQEHYDSVACTYDNHYDHLTRGRPYHDHLSDHLIKALPEKGDLLDIGCGTALFAEKYLRNGGTATGLDISGKMLARARERCPGCTFVVGKGETLPFRDGSFDAISSLLVFSYVKTPDTMLAEANRVLRPGGSIAVCTLGKKLITKGIPALYHISEKVKFQHVVMKNFGERYYNEEEMIHLFSDAGFTDITVKWCSFAHIDMIDPLFSLASKLEPFVEKRVPQLAFNIFVSAKKRR